MTILGYEPITKQKAPKNYAEGISWINVALREFGIAGLTLRPLVEFLKSALGNANAAVRTSATSALVTLKLFAGPCESCAICSVISTNSDRGLFPQLSRIYWRD